MMFRLWIILHSFLFLASFLYGQSPSFDTFINPIIPGDHPDPTLTKIGRYFYTSGSSFNPTPKIYRSTDLVHWQVIAQPVSASWSQYGDNPGGGIWGGHMIFYNGRYWHYLGRGGGRMYFVTADSPEGPWSVPTSVNVPAGMSGLGVDNSVFIDEETGKWYLLTKAGQQNNHIVELGENGQPTGVVLDLTWLNPNSQGNPYGWAEGPVMWKYKGYYYYSFAEHLVGRQYVMRSETLTSEKSAWTIVGTNMFTGPTGNYNRPNHISPVVMLDDGTSWCVAHSYHSNAGWYAHGRQGLLCQVTYNNQDFPVIQYPSNNAAQAPALPSSGIPWMVPKSDNFNVQELKPEWSFLGYTPDRTWSLTEREGWLYLEPYGGRNTVIQNDGEHSYSIITRVDFEPESASEKAGLWILNGPETHYAKVFSTVNAEGKKVLALSFENTLYEAENTVGSIVWLKLFRNEHNISGYYSADGIYWTMIGEPVNAAPMDREQTQFNDFTGNQQGLFVERKPAWFDLYIYRDAYSPIMAECPANQYGTSQRYSRQGYVLDNIHTDDWAMYAGVDFGSADYRKTPDSLKIVASSTASGSSVQVWLDSLDTGEKIADCAIDNTGSLTTFQ
ncbi:family 43 glycosylhydrolase, partial [candidate division KSB1 bacterium]|nr:family 43 glycosylhydrolase [candidate division KSB1 bacterium]